MKSYSETDIFAPFELRLLETTIRAFKKIKDPDTKKDPLIRCHEFMRAIAAITEHKNVVDGHFGPVDHTWIDLVVKFPKKGVSHHLLDGYCVGSLPSARLIDAEKILPYEVAYRPGKPRDDIRQWVVDDLVKQLTIDGNHRLCYDCLEKRAAKTWPDHLREDEEPILFLCEDCQLERRYTVCRHPRYRRVDSHLPDECMVCGD